MGLDMLRRRAERVSNVFCSCEQRGCDEGSGGGGGGGGILYVIDPACWGGVDRVRIWSVVIA